MIPETKYEDIINPQTGEVTGQRIVSQTHPSVLPREVYDPVKNAWTFYAPGEAVPTPAATPLITSSSLFRNDISQLDSGIAKLEASQAGIDAMLAGRKTQLETRLTGELGGIETAYGQKAAALERAQKEEAGMQTKGLIELGGQLGTSVSGEMAPLQKLRMTHQEEIGALEAARQNAIRAARSAFEDKDFELAKTQKENARDFEKEIFNRKQKFFENYLKYTEFQSGEAEKKRKAAQETLETVTKLGSDALKDYDFSKIEESLGLPRGGGLRLAEVVQRKQKAQDQKDLLAVQKDLLGILADIPAGQTIDLPNGDGTFTTYKGMQPVDKDISMTVETDQFGKSTAVFYSRKTGAHWTADLGKISAPKKEEAQEVLNDTARNKLIAKWSAEGEDSRVLKSIGGQPNRWANTIYGYLQDYSSEEVKKAVSELGGRTEWVDDVIRVMKGEPLIYGEVKVEDEED